MYMFGVVRHLFAVYLVLVSVLSSHAMSLGPAKGTAWIGRPLDVGVQINLEPDEDPAALCLAADVLYGDTPVNSGQVRLIVDPGASPGEALLRIRSSAPVDEPVVSLNLKAGCAQALVRRYVILAEIPSEARAESKVVDPGLVTPGNQVREEKVQPRADTGADVRQGVADRKSSRARPVASKGARAGSASARRPASPVAETGASRVRSSVRSPAPESQLSKPRLKLEPAEMTLERGPVLRSSPALASEPQDGGATREEAAARWRAIGSTQEEIVKDGQRLQSIQADLSLLKEQRQKDQAEIAELRSRLQAAESGRLGRGWFLGLALAMIAAFGVAFHYWRRSRIQPRPQWWSPVVDGSGDGRWQSPVQESASHLGAGATLATTGVDRIADNTGATGAAVVATSGSDAKPPHSSVEPVDFQNSLSGTGRAVRVDELLDIQQQADFFISLGQYEQAVATLRNHIADNVETSVLAYLDLLKIYHLQGRDKDYELVRHEFNQLFNAEVPEITSFKRQTRGLEAYQPILSRITALWPSPAVLDFLEESIFRKPGQGSQVLDLEAYRELLMLYAVAKDLVQVSRSGQNHLAPNKVPPAVPDHLVQARERTERRPAEFQLPRTEPQAMGILSDDEPFESRSPSLMRVPPSPNLGLDIDLSELVPIRPEASTSQPLQKVSEIKAPESPPIDFDLFDLATKAHADMKRGKS